MGEELTDDQSHYEVSLTAGQAFLAFVLLLLSLAASFAFGLVIGRGQGDDRMTARKEAALVTEASLVPKKTAHAAADVPVRSDDFKEAAAAPAPKVIEEPKPAGGQAPSPVRAKAAAPPKPAAAPAVHPPNPESRVPSPAPAPAPVPHYAQLLSTSDQKIAEALAAKLIDGGFTAAYVERGPATEKGTIFRVRVKFPSEEAAKAAEPKLKTFSKDVWITK